MRSSSASVVALGVLAAIFAAVAFLGQPKTVPLPTLARLEPLALPLDRPPAPHARSPAADAPYLEAWSKVRRPQLQAALRIARSSYAQQRWSAAEADFEIAQLVEPTRAFLALYRGSALALDGRLDAARDALDMCIAIGDDVLSHEARWQLAQIALAVGDAPSARQLLESVRAGEGARAPAAAEQLAALP